MNEIARGAGVEKAALYWHFESKAELLAAVLDRMDVEVVERIAKRGRRGRPRPAPRPVPGGDEEARQGAGHLVRLTLSVAIERSAISPESRAAVLRIFERTRIAVEQGFEQALGVKLPDMDLIARLVLAYLVEAAVREAVDPGAADHERFFAHLRRLIALDVERQLRVAGVAVPPERSPKRR